VVDLTAEAPLLRVGYVGHDHHSAVYISALRGEQMRDQYGIYLAPLREGELYALVENDVKVAEVEFFKATGGGSVVPTSMAAGEFDMGFGGVAAFVSSSDAGSGIAIVAPLHARGDMLVVAPDNPATDWPTFVDWVEASQEPVYVGYKNPTAVALMIFESALTAEGIPYSHATPAPGARVVLMNMQGEENLIPGLVNGTIHAYVSNNPWCAMAEHDGSGRCIAELADLPPALYANHPCCAIAATLDARTNKAETVAAVLRLFAAATDYINANPDDAAAAVAEWLEKPLEVELASMPTSTYDMHVTDEWDSSMLAMMDEMRSRDMFAGPLDTLSGDAALALIADFSLLPDDLK
jgi:ABC-type nitrate/sulfonate/bicarbonate transport system substrate-binding protein